MRCGVWCVRVLVCAIIVTKIVHHCRSTYIGLTSDLWINKYEPIKIENKCGTLVLRERERVQGNVQYGFDGCWRYREIHTQTDRNWSWAVLSPRSSCHELNQLIMTNGQMNSFAQCCCCCCRCCCECRVMFTQSKDVCLHTSSSATTHFYLIVVLFIPKCDLYSIVVHTPSPSLPLHSVSVVFLSFRFCSVLFRLFYFSK